MTLILNPNSGHQPCKTVQVVMRMLGGGAQFNPLNTCLSKEQYGQMQRTLFKAWEEQII